MNGPEEPLVPAPRLPRRPDQCRVPEPDRTLGSLGRGTAVMMAATVIYVAFQFLTRVLVTHLVSGEQWGEFNIGFAIANLLALIAAFGIPTAVARSLAYEETVRSAAEPGPAGAPGERPRGRGGLGPGLSWGRRSWPPSFTIRPTPRCSSCSA